MRARILGIIVVALSVFHNASAQDLSNLHLKKVKLSDESTLLDTLSIFPSSLDIIGYDTSDFSLDSTLTHLLWRADLPKDSITVLYRTLPLRLTEVHRHKSVDLIGIDNSQNPFNKISESTRFIGSQSALNTVGNISRGIGFGNRQDLTVNSNLNLRFNGLINDQVNVNAAISDQNNVLQPEGNTQQIQDFDRVFMEFSKDSSRLIAGDFLMSRPEGSHFMNYNKKSRGVQLNHVIENDKARHTIIGDFAISRGRFARNIIEGIEGNQGPYRLSGANGETFIIVISGTEKVYLDGELLTRGEQNDYVIDYNSGEVRFTPKRLITRYTRIIVEFQYADRNYGRSVVHLGSVYKTKKWRIKGNYFSEQDNKNQPFQQNLDDSIGGLPTRSFISQAGDVEQLFAPRFELQPYTNGEILYVRKDTLGYTIFEQTNVSKDSLYRVQFSFVGQGNGNYIQISSSTVGKVFEWVEPIGGVPQGNYEPVDILIPPIRLQMLNIGFDYYWNKHTSASIEYVWTNNDMNTFSALDEDDDNGHGIRIDFKKHTKLNQDTLKLWELATELNYEFTQNNFRYIERYRDVEFYRRWNPTIENPLENADYLTEQILGAKVKLFKGDKVQFDIDQSIYRRGTNSGHAQAYKATWKSKIWGLESYYDKTISDLPYGGMPTENNFGSLGGSILYKTKKARSSLSFVQEQSAFNRNSDTLLASSYGYDLIQYKLSGSDSTKFKYQLLANKRLDYRPLDGQLNKFSDGTDIQLSFDWVKSRYAQFTYTSTLRQLTYLDSSYGNSENTVQGRLETKLSTKKRWLTTNAYYQLGTGQDQRREFTYIEVGDGLGNYIWNDYDSNGVATLNEFEFASSFDQGRANFIRQLLPVQGFIKSYSSEFNQTIRIQPRRALGKSNKAFPKLVNRFSNITSVKVAKKVSETGIAFYNPLIPNNDSAILNTNSFIRSIFSFNQASPIFGVDYQLLDNQSNVLLINGIDQRKNAEQKLRVRYNVKRNYEFTLEARQGDKEYLSQFLKERSFHYTYQAIKPQFGWQHKTSFRWEVYYEYFTAINALNLGGETTFNHDFTSEFRWNTLNKGFVRASIGLVDVNFNGNDNSPVAYELLAGLRNGRNIKWAIQIQRRLQNNLQLSFNYTGRQTISIPTIHIGQVQARYLF